MSNPFKNKTPGIFIGILAVFLLSRFFGIGQIYHQDEYRWAVIANPIFHNFSSPHPPLTRYLLRFTGELLGFENLRYGIMLFGLLNLFLIYGVLKKISGQVHIAL